MEPLPACHPPAPGWAAALDNGLQPMRLVSLATALTAHWVAAGDDDGYIYYDDEYMVTADDDGEGPNNCCASPYAAAGACGIQGLYVESGSTYCYEVNERCRPPCMLASNATGSSCHHCCAPYASDQYCNGIELGGRYYGWVWWLVFWLFICPMCVWATLNLYDEEVDPSERVQFAATTRTFPSATYATGVAPSYTASPVVAPAYSAAGQFTLCSLLFPHGSLDCSEIYVQQQRQVRMTRTFRQQ